MNTLLKVAKKNYKQSLKNKVRYQEKRGELIKQMLESQTPDWGGIKIKLVK